MAKTLHLTFVWLVLLPTTIRRHNVKTPSWTGEWLSPDNCICPHLTWNFSAFRTVRNKTLLFMNVSARDTSVRGAGAKTIRVWQSLVIAFHSQWAECVTGPSPQGTELITGDVIICGLSFAHNAEGSIEDCLGLCGQTALFIMLTLPLTKSLVFPVRNEMNLAVPIYCTVVQTKWNIHAKCSVQDLSPLVVIISSITSPYLCLCFQIMCLTIWWCIFYSSFP